MAQFLLLIFGMAFVSLKPSYGFQCLIVSGAKPSNLGGPDRNGAFQNAPQYQLPVTLKNGAVCEIFDSWVSLAQVLPKKQKNFKPQERILVVIAGHGSGACSQKGVADSTCSDPNTPGWTAALNTGWVYAGPLLETLGALSQSHPVGLLIDSCYSGEVLKHKLVLDRLAQQQQDYEQVDRLCLQTTSDFGQSAMGNRLQFHLTKPTDNLLDFYRKTGEGLSSAGLWDTLGFTDFILQKNLKTAQNLAFNWVSLREQHSSTFTTMALESQNNGFYTEYNRIHEITTLTSLKGIHTEQDWIDTVSFELLHEWDQKKQTRYNLKRLGENTELFSLVSSLSLGQIQRTDLDQRRYNACKSFRFSDAP